MKKSKGIVCILFCLHFFAFKVNVFANNSGSLKINTSIQNNPQQNGIHYIEQENDLSALFKEETTIKIQSQQDKVKKEEQNDTQNIFVMPSSSKSITANYTAVLFNEDTAIKLKETQQIKLKTEGSSISVAMVTVMVIAGMIMGYSIMKVTVFKKG